MVEFGHKTTFAITENIREAILIAGTVVCAHTNETFTGPVILSKTNTLYRFDPENKPRILTILSHPSTDRMNNNNVPKREARRVSVVNPHTQINGFASTGCQVKHEAIM